MTGSYVDEVRGLLLWREVHSAGVLLALDASKRGRSAVCDNGTDLLCPDEAKRCMQPIIAPVGINPNGAATR